MQNLEAKFKLYDLDRARKQAEALKYHFKATLAQRDTFFRVKEGNVETSRRRIRRLDDFLWPGRQ